EHEIAMNLIGYENQIALGAKVGKRGEFVGRPRRAAGIVWTAQEDDLRSRREFVAQRVEVHRVAPLPLDELRIENATLVGDDDLSECVVGGREHHGLVARRTDSLQDQAEA